MTQWIKCFLHKVQDLSLDLIHPNTTTPVIKTSTGLEQSGGAGALKLTVQPVSPKH